MTKLRIAHIKGEDGKDKFIIQYRSFLRWKLATFIVTSTFDDFHNALRGAKKYMADCTPTEEIIQVWRVV